MTNLGGDPGKEEAGEEQSEYGSGDDAVDGERQLGNGVAEGVEEEGSAHDEDSQRASDRLAHQHPLLLWHFMSFYEWADEVFGYHVRERVLTRGYGAVGLKIEV